MAGNKSRMSMQLLDCDGDKIFSGDKLKNKSSGDLYSVKFGRYSLNDESWSYGFYLINLEYLSIHEIPEDFDGKIKLKKEHSNNDLEKEIYLNLKCSGVDIGGEFNKRFAATYSDVVQIGENEYKQVRTTKVFSYRDSFLKVIEWLKSIGVKDPNVNSVDISEVE